MDDIMSRTNNCISPQKPSRTQLKGPSLKSFHKELNSIRDANLLLLHYGVIVSPKRRNAHHPRGRNLGSGMKPWRAHKSISPRPTSIRNTDEGSNTKRHTRKAHDDLHDRLLRTMDSSQEHKRYKTQQLKTSPVLSPISSTGDDTVLRPYNSPNGQETFSHIYSQGDMTSRTDSMKKLVNVQASISTNEHSCDNSFAELYNSNESCKQDVNEHRILDIDRPSSQSVMKETTEDDRVTKLQEMHRQEIIELKKDYACFVDKLRESYQQREKEQQLILRKLNQDIKQMRQEMDVLKVSSQQSLDSVRLSMENNCKALQLYVAEEIAESKQEMQTEHSIATEFITSPSGCTNSRGQLQNDGATFKASESLHGKDVDALQSPVPTLQSWNDFTQRFRRAISGDTERSTESGWKIDHTTTINATRFIEEISFLSSETYFDAEC